MHYFSDEKAYSERPEHYALLLAACLAIWTAALSGLAYNTDLPTQRLGIDWSVGLHDGRVITVDSKVRRVDYGDVALEYLHQEADGTTQPGWVEKRLSCDLIAYMVAPSRTVYFIPFRPLRKWWRANRDQLLKRYRTARAPNPGYTGLSCCIPVSVLLAAVPSTRVIHLDKESPNA